MTALTDTLSVSTWAGWEQLMRDAYVHAANSPDPSTQNAAFLVATVPGRPGGGWVYERTYAVNEFPAGVLNRPDRWERPLKYAIVEHAERNSIYQAARLGLPTEGLTMVCPWAACADCARAIIQAGISNLVTHAQAHARSPQAWRDSIAVAFEMLAEAGVTVTMVDAAIGAGPVLHTGQLWAP